MKSTDESSPRIRKCVNCSEELHADNPEHYKRHIPPIPDEFVTTEDDIAVRQDVKDALDLASDYEFGEGAVMHVGGAQTTVSTIDDVDEWVETIDHIHKIRPYSPYSSECTEEEVL